MLPSRMAMQLLGVRMWQQQCKADAQNERCCQVALLGRHAPGGGAHSPGLTLATWPALLLLLQSLPLPYCAARPALWQQLRSSCAHLAPLLPQLPHSALALLDAAAAANLVDAPASQLEQDGAALPPPGAVPQAHMLAACVVVAAQAAAAKGQLAAIGASLPSEQDVCGQFGLQLAELVSAAAQLREACGAACRAPTSAYAVVDLYLEALLAGQVDRQVRCCCVGLKWGRGSAWRLHNVNLTLQQAGVAVLSVRSFVSVSCTMPPS